MEGHVLEGPLEEGAAGCGLQAMSCTSKDDLAVEGRCSRHLLPEGSCRSLQLRAYGHR